jgi:ubiquinone/menaquinone biosynthesis C-methylase UbiE
MPAISFRLMALTMEVMDFLHPYIDKRVMAFDIHEGMTVVDYGCGPGRYTMRFSKLVGATGKVYAVDIHELAIEFVSRKMDRYGLKNVVAVLANGYDSPLPDHVADVVCALDMFFAIKQPSQFLTELKRITRPGGTLIIDDGHQPRDATKRKILDSGLWRIREESRDHLKCQPS